MLIATGKYDVEISRKRLARSREAARRARQLERGTLRMTPTRAPRRIDTPMIIWPSLAAGQGRIVLVERGQDGRFKEKP